MIILADSHTDRDAWLAARMDRVCGSEAPALLGESSYMTREQLRMCKAGLVDEWQGSEQTDLGLDLEPAIAAAATRKWGWKMERCGLLIQDPHCPALAATPDYFVETPWGRAVCQIKLTTCQAAEDCKPRKSGEPSTARYAHGAPLDFQIQITAELAAVGLEWGCLLVLHACAPTFKLRAYPVQRNDGVVSRIRREAVLLMDEVRALRAGRVA